MSAALREIRLYGRLGAEFGRVFHLAVQSPAEAVRALSAVLPGFRAAFLGEEGLAEYWVRLGRGRSRVTIGAEAKDDLVPASAPICFVPVVAGAKRQGLGQTILGATLWVAGTALELYGAFGGGGPFAVVAGSYLQQIGIAMVIGGVVQMLSPQRRADTSTTNDPSYGMDAGAVNNTDAGAPVPLAYGRIIAGSVQVSAGLSTDEFVPPAPVGPISPLTRPGYMPQYEVDSGAVAGRTWGEYGG